MFRLVPEFGGQGTRSFQESIVPKFPTDSFAIQTGGASTIKDLNEVNKVKSLKDQKTHSAQEIDKAAKGFEALLLHQMMKSMWETVDQTGFLGEDSNQGQIVRDMFNQSVADQIAEGRGIGVKDVVKKEVLRREKASSGNE